MSKKHPLFECRKADNTATWTCICGQCCAEKLKTENKTLVRQWQEEAIKWGKERAKLRELLDELAEFKNDYCDCGFHLDIAERYEALSSSACNQGEKK